MPEITLSRRYDVTADEMWERIGDPLRLHDWHPAIESVEALDGGHRRINTVVGGVRVSETILGRSEREHSWRIDESPLPLDGFVGTIRVREDGTGCVVECHGTLPQDGGSEQEGIEVTRQFFQAGLDAL